MTVLLIAEDDTDIRTVLRLLFTRRGYTVLTAADGDEALRLAQQHRPDAVLTDLDMPGMNGLELCRALRSDPGLRTVPVAVLSGSLMPGDPRVHGSAMCELLSKPIPNAALVATMQRVVELGAHEHDTATARCHSRS